MLNDHVGMGIRVIFQHDDKLQIVAGDEFKDRMGQESPVKDDTLDFQPAVSKEFAHFSECFGIDLIPIVGEEGDRPAVHSIHSVHITDRGFIRPGLVFSFAGQFADPALAIIVSAVQADPDLLDAPPAALPDPQDPELMDHVNRDQAVKCLAQPVIILPFFGEDHFVFHGGLKTVCHV